MSEREMCAQLLDHVPDFKLRYVLAYLQGLTADEIDDDAFCEQLYQEYLADPDVVKIKKYVTSGCCIFATFRI